MLDFIKKRSIKAAALCTAAVMIFTACNNEGSESSGGGSSGSDWSFSQMAMGGGGYVTGVFSTCEEGLYYARTDVGGAYRWDSEQGKWVSLSYWVSEDDVGLMGIDGLAVDPDEPNKIYLAAGTSYFSNGKTCILISEDYGNTFEAVDVSDLIKVSGNGMGRQNGERIAIDPVNNDILYVGGRSGGLIKSTDGGKTWTQVTSLTEAANVNTSNSNGICTVAVDPDSSDGSQCSRIFVGISEGSEKNVLVSEDGGETWSTVSGLPSNLYPQRMRLDGQGSLLIVYADSEGPWGGGGTGGIIRLDIATGETEDISPANLSFGDIAVDPSNPDRMVAVTECIWAEQPNGAFGDEFFVTEDGGETWTCINDKMTMTSDIEWVKDYAIHWCGCLAIDQFDGGKIKVVSGNGIFACDNIFDDEPAFYFDSTGIEETVPMELVSIPDGPIVTAIGDYDGFVNEDAFEYGTIHSSHGSTMNDIDVAYKNTDVWVKCGDGGFYYTLDGGETWNTPKTSPASGATAGAAGVSADGKRFFWAPEGMYTIYYSDDYGETWQQSENMISAGYIVCDTVNPDYVYVTSKSAFYVSDNGGESFTETYTFFSSTRITVVPDKEGVVYIPAMGLQISTDYGQTFTRLDSLAGCLGVGVGTGKDENSPEVLYVWGRPASDDELGIYWSVDGGESWERIGDSSCQFGGMGNGYFIKGDSNVYGRCYISTVGLGVVVCDLTDKS